MEGLQALGGGEVEGFPVIFPVFPSFFSFFWFHCVFFFDSWVFPSFLPLAILNVSLVRWAGQKIRDAFVVFECSGVMIWALPF